VTAEESEYLAGRLAEWRKRKGWSQQDLAQSAALSIATIRAIETRRVQDPGIFTMSRVVVALGESLDGLVQPAMPAKDD